LKNLPDGIKKAHTSGCDREKRKLLGKEDDDWKDADTPLGPGIGHCIILERPGEKEEKHGIDEQS
jgi:hypothetical protein